MITPRSQWNAALSPSTVLATASSTSGWSSSHRKRISGTCSFQSRAQSRCAGSFPTRFPRKEGSDIAAPRFNSFARFPNCIFAGLRSDQMSVNLRRPKARGQVTWDLNTERTESAEKSNWRTKLVPRPPMVARDRRPSSGVKRKQVPRRDAPRDRNPVWDF